MWVSAIGGPDQAHEQNHLRFRHDQSAHADEAHCGTVPTWRHAGRSAATRPTRIGSLRSGRALGYVAEPGYDDPDGASIIDPDGRGPTIGFLRVPEGKTAKNRMHIDIRTAGEPPWVIAEREQRPCPRWTH
jgi:hypothetical protein